MVEMEEQPRPNTLRPRFVLALFVLYLIAGWLLEQQDETQSLDFFESRSIRLFSFKSDFYLLRLLGNTQRFIFYLLIAPLPYLTGFAMLWFLVHLLLMALYAAHQNAKTQPLFTQE